MALISKNSKSGEDIISKFLEIVESVSVLLLSVSNNSEDFDSWLWYSKGSDISDNFPKAARGGDVKSSLISLINYIKNTYIGAIGFCDASEILIIVRYCLVTDIADIDTVKSVASIEFSRLLLGTLFFENDIEEAIEFLLLIALLWRLLRVSKRLVLLIYFTSEEVSFIWKNLGEILLIQWTLEKTLILLLGISI